MKKVAVCLKTGKPHRWMPAFKRKHNKHVNYRVENGTLVYLRVYQCADCINAFKTVRE